LTRGRRRFRPILGQDDAMKHDGMSIVGHPYDPVMASIGIHNMQE
jgi:hypothetical protein